MPVGLYLDHHVPRAIAAGLRLRQVDVLTAAEDGMAESADPALLDRATTLGRVLFSQDRHLLMEAARRQTEGIAFSGVIYGHQLHAAIGVYVHDLELIAATVEPDEVRGQVVFLPL